MTIVTYDHYIFTVQAKGVTATANDNHAMKGNAKLVIIKCFIYRQVVICGHFISKNDNPFLRQVGSEATKQKLFFRKFTPSVNGGLGRESKPRSLCFSFISSHS